MKRLLPILFLLLTACATTFQSPQLPQIDDAIEQAIAEKRIPGGVLWIERDGRVYTRAYGNRALVPNAERATTDTIYDAASITKPVATASSIGVLVEQGKVALDEKVKTYLPEYVDAGVTVRHLLTHTSGLRPGTTPGGAIHEPPKNAPGAIFRYSDVNYMLLGQIVERVSGQPLDTFAKQHVFAPLGMRDTTFKPSPSTRIAPTENGLRAVVHDPTARALGGVAGHAGMFTNARDLARFARHAMTHPLLARDITPEAVAIRRTGGFDLDSAYSRPGGDRFPQGSFGHTGWTGGFLWIDPASRSFYIFLSNRVHPDGKGSVVSLQKQLGNLVGEAFGYEPRARRVQHVVGGGDAQNGIDVLHSSAYEQLRGLRIGLITNQSGIDRTGNPTVDLLRSAPGVTLAAIFTPEHGLRGTLDDKVADEQYRGITVFSLYGERRKPAPEQLANLDALVFDVQDIGTRFYTYISTMGLAMEAAAEAKIGFIVLDRVNPIGDVVEGPALEGTTNFTGWHPIPIRHGKTVGELAQL
ncbi:MAG TPA: serine hydrolase, partial [Thermoanaerobaculia bacterium]